MHHDLSEVVCGNNIWKKEYSFWSFENRQFIRVLFGWKCHISFKLDNRFIYQIFIINLYPKNRQNINSRWYQNYKIQFKKNLCASTFVILLFLKKMSFFIIELLKSWDEPALVEEYIWIFNSIFEYRMLIEVNSISINIQVWKALTELHVIVCYTSKFDASFDVFLMIETHPKKTFNFSQRCANSYEFVKEFARKYVLSMILSFLSKW